jgi:hypothetical protein
MLKGEFEINSAVGSQGTYSENWYSDSLKKIQLTLSQGRKKKVDIVADDEDDGDAVRTRVSQERMTATPCAEELFLSTQYK